MPSQTESKPINDLQINTLYPSATAKNKVSHEPQNDPKSGPILSDHTVSTSTVLITSELIKTTSSQIPTNNLKEPQRIPSGKIQRKRI